MKRLFLIPLLALAACKSDPPPDSVAVVIDPDTFAPLFGDSPHEEVALDYYKTLTAWAKEYPSLRPEIVEAITNDGIVTYGEFGRISTEQKSLAVAEGQKDWNKEAEPYRQALKDAAS